MSLTVPSRQWPAAYWFSIVVAAIPLAWLTATLGFTISVTSPLRDIALLLLWSTSEEIVFRGGVQTLVARALSRQGHPERVERGLLRHLSPANLLTSLLFCAAHLVYKPAPVVAGLMPVSLLLGASLERSRRLWVPMALHAYFNLLLYGASAMALA